MRTKNPFFAKCNVKYYCDDTEPKLYPHAYDEYVLKSEADAEKQALEVEVRVLREQRDESLREEFGPPPHLDSVIAELDAEIEAAKGGV